MNPLDPWELPTSLTVGGRSWDIRWDYRAVIDILRYFSDPEYEEDERAEIMLDILYVDYASMPDALKEEAAQKAVSFIDMDIPEDRKPARRLMDWEQDAPLIVTGVNHVLNTEIRMTNRLHWWTFLGAYLEISNDSLYSQVVCIRDKKSRGKKLEKLEQQFYRENRALIDLKPRYSEEDLAEKKRLLAALEGSERGM
ncbi:MAG: bacteriophage Gp15 family protein [Clostridiales bacterium]|nr:bacteriophage Gp15 family protein [Clostridiales bacterium]